MRLQEEVEREGCHQRRPVVERRPHLHVTEASSPPEGRSAQEVGAVQRLVWATEARQKVVRHLADRRVYWIRWSHRLSKSSRQRKPKWTSRKRWKECPGIATGGDGKMGDWPEGHPAMANVVVEIRRRCQSAALKLAVAEQTAPKVVEHSALPLWCCR